MKTIILYITIYLLAVSLTGCGEASKAYFEEASLSTEALAESTEFVTDTEAAELASTEAAEPLQECCVYICGAVNRPGVYILPAGSRIYEAVKQAGGLTDDASESSVNQAEEVTDGQMIRVPTTEEAEKQESNEPDTAEGIPEPSDGRINLNTADISELMTLPGIGESKAQSILSYREETGGFASAEEIMNITGIKEGIYTKIKDYITVN